MTDLRQSRSTLRVRRMGVDTSHEPVVYMHRDCAVCRSEGFESRSRVEVRIGRRKVLASLHVVHGDLVEVDEAGLSEAAWNLLRARPGDVASFTHPEPLVSLAHVRAKIYGHRLDAAGLKAVVGDIAQGRYSPAQMAAFVAACGGDRLDLDEIVMLTQAMVEAGERLSWNADIVVDKHSVGGVPGNRTTLIVVPIVAEFGLLMPKTSSRAITSPAGTADTMGVLAPVDLSPEEMRRVVEAQNGCIVWGGAVRLSPADDVLIRVERELDIDSEGQMVASVLSKKAAAGSTHVVVDMPIGPTAKVRTSENAERLATIFRKVGKAIGLKVNVVMTDGTQPVGRGIGPALEARDVLSVLQCRKNAPQDLRERGLLLAGAVLENSGRVPAGQGRAAAEKILDSGAAWKRFQAICEAQGGMRRIPVSRNRYDICARRPGVITSIDMRRLALMAKLAGAPEDPCAGIDLLVRIGSRVERDQPMFTVHAESVGELEYALEYLSGQEDIIVVADTEPPAA
jgi:thymidine phosphorylase